MQKVVRQDKEPKVGDIFKAHVCSAEALVLVKKVEFIKGRVISWSNVVEDSASGAVVDVLASIDLSHC